MRMDRKDTEDKHKYIFHILITSPKDYINMFFQCLSIGIFPFLKMFFYRWSGKLRNSFKRFSSSPGIHLYFERKKFIIHHHLMLFLIHRSIYKKNYEGNFKPWEDTSHPFPFYYYCFECIPFHILVEGFLMLACLLWFKLQQYVYRDETLSVSPVISTSKSFFKEASL